MEPPYWSDRAETARKLTECNRSHERNLGISKGSKSVHAMGTPINHSTQRGDKAPPAWAFSGALYRLVVCAGPAQLWASCPVGVAHVRGIVLPPPPSPRIASVSETPGWALFPEVFLLPLESPSDLVGVGHRPRLAIVDSDWNPFVRYSLPVCGSIPLFLVP
jgi:hypothetical protein